MCRKCIFKIIKIFLVMEALTLFVVPVIFVAIFGVDGAEMKTTAMSNLSQCIILGISWCYIHRVGREKTLANRIDYKAKICHIVLVLVLFLANSFFMDGLVLVKIGETNDFSYANNVFSIDVISFLEMIFAYGILPAICEEFFYRKMIYGQMFIDCKMNSMIMTSGFLFAFAHHSFDKIVPMFLLGSALMWIYVKTKNIVWCIVLHSIYNVLVLFFQHILVLPSSSSLISIKYASGLECIAAGMKYISVGMIIYLILYWIVVSIRGVDYEK